MPSSGSRRMRFEFGGTMERTRRSKLADAESCCACFCIFAVANPPCESLARRCCRGTPRRARITEVGARCAHLGPVNRPRGRCPCQTLAISWAATCLRGHTGLSARTATLTEGRCHRKCRDGRRKRGAASKASGERDDHDAMRPVMRPEHCSCRLCADCQQEWAIGYYNLAAKPRTGAYSRTSWHRRLANGKWLWSY